MARNRKKSSQRNSRSQKRRSSHKKPKNQKECLRFKEEDVYQFCLMKICTSLIAPIFRQLLRWLHPEWKWETEEFETYLKQKNMTDKELKEFMKNIHKTQRPSMVEDPHGRTWDITLTYCAIKNTNSSLASWRDQDAWTKESDKLEYVLTKLKNERNKVAHPGMALNTNTYKEWCEDISTGLEELLSRIKSRCSHVSQKKIDEKIKGVKLSINEIMNSPVQGSGFDPSRYAEYKREMEQHRECVITEGKDDLKERHSNRNSLEVTSYLAAQMDLPIEKTYVEMVLEEDVSGEQTPVEVKSLLEESDSLYYLEGRAGVGKTSLIKYLTMVWAKEKGEVEGLEEYDLLFHLAGRDHHISSFDQFLSLSMPTIVKKMSIDILHSILYGLRSIIVFDGYDEKNEESAQVLKEILSLKKDFKFTLLVTSRPEATEQFYVLANSHGIRIKHVKVLGIPKSKQTEFLQKYASLVGYSDDIAPLLMYVERTERRLSDVWKLPYNLSILAFLWMNNHSLINSITTSSELHWQMHQTNMSKLKERLLNYQGTKYLPSSLLDRKIEDFLDVLCEVSLTSLANDDITLTEDLYERLFNRCRHLEIPSEEMIGAFLKPSQSETCKRYSYPHKGVSDFLAALYIYLRLCSTSNFDIDQVQKRIMNDLTFGNAPEDLCQQIKEVFDTYKVQPDNSGVRVPLALMGGKIRKILDEIPGGILKNDLWKCHNMLINLTGILYIEGKSGGVHDEIKQEALELLQNTGVTDRSHWLGLLNDAKCDEFMVSFISQETDVLKGNICIDDGNLFAYNSLFRATKSSEDSVDINIDVKESLADVGDFLSQINGLKFQVRALTVTENNIEEYVNIISKIKTKFENPDMVYVKIRMLKKRKPLLNLRNTMKNNDLHVKELDLEFDFRSFSTATADFDDSNVIKEIFPRCEKYVGVWSTAFSIHGGMKELRVRLPNDANCDGFLDLLTGATKLTELDISFKAALIPATRQIPEWIKTIHVYIPHVRTEEEAGKVVNILLGFGRRFCGISFPHCCLNEDGIKRILDSLREVTVECVVFPENLRHVFKKKYPLTASQSCIRWLSDEHMWDKIEPSLEKERREAIISRELRKRRKRQIVQEQISARGQISELSQPTLQKMFDHTIW